MFYILFAIALVASISLCYVFTKKGTNELAMEKITKVSTVVYIAITMLGCFLPDLFMSPIGDPALEMPLGKLGAILRWLNAICFVALPIAVYQKNKYFEKIASFVSLPIAVINVAFYSHYMYYYTKVPSPGGGFYTLAIASESFKELLLNVTFRSVLFGLCCLAQILALAILTYKNRSKLALAKGEIKNFILILLGVTYISLPVFVPQFFFGHVDIEMQRFTVPHIIWIICIPLIIVALYFIFRNKSYETRYLLVLSLSWALMYQFTYMFSGAAELNIMKLPLQLCNLGSYLALIMLARKSEKIYHFTLIVNVVGALIAIIILDIVKKDSSLTHFFVIHYIVEHTKVMIIPILCLVLKVFKPLTLKSLKHFSIGFTAYWFFILVLGTLSNGFKRMPEFADVNSFFTANHLFMFDKGTAKGLVGFTDPLFENGVIKIGHFEIYPLVQLLVYIVFMVICFGVFFLIYGLTRKQRLAYLASSVDTTEESEHVEEEILVVEPECVCEVSPVVEPECVCKVSPVVEPEYVHEEPQVVEPILEQIDVEEHTEQCGDEEVAPVCEINTSYFSERDQIILAAVNEQRESDDHYQKLMVDAAEERRNDIKNILLSSAEEHRDIQNSTRSK